MRTVMILSAAMAAQLPGHAQFSGYQGNVGGTIGMGIPKGEFADTWGQNMFTWGGQITLPARILPLQWGFAFDYGVMGNRNFSVPVSSPELTATEGDLAVRAKVLSYHPLLRFSPLKGKVRPYVDGMAGFRQFTTKSTVTVDGLQEPVLRERNANDLALSTGWAAGLMIRLGSVGYVEGRVERFYSGKASYVDPSSISVDGAGHLAFNTLESNTDGINVLVGLGLRF
jgi:hypothetical protein